MHNSDAQNIANTLRASTGSAPWYPTGLLTLDPTKCPQQTSKPSIQRKAQRAFNNQVCPHFQISNPIPGFDGPSTSIITFLNLLFEECTVCYVKITVFSSLPMHLCSSAWITKEVNNGTANRKMASKGKGYWRKIGHINVITWSGTFLHIWLIVGSTKRTNISAYQSPHWWVEKWYTSVYNPVSQVHKQYTPAKCLIVMTTYIALLLNPAHFNITYTFHWDFSLHHAWLRNFQKQDFKTCCQQMVQANSLQIADALVPSPYQKSPPQSEMWYYSN